MIFSSVWKLIKRNKIVSMALPSVGLTCYLNTALHLLADVTRNAAAAIDERPQSMLAAALAYLRCSRSVDMPCQMPRALMINLCSELKIQVGIPDDPSSILMQLCSEKEMADLVGKCLASRVCNKCGAQAQIGLPGMPFSVVEVPLTAPRIELLSLLDTENKCASCGCPDTSIQFGDKHTLIYITRDVRTTQVRVSFPRFLCKEQELMGIALWNSKSIHYTYISRHTDGTWRYYNDEAVTIMPHSWIPDGDVVNVLADSVVALVYGPPSTTSAAGAAAPAHKQLYLDSLLPEIDNDSKDQLVNDIFKLSPLKPKQFSCLQPNFINGPWIRVCLNDNVVGRMLYISDCSCPYVTRDNWIVFYDAYCTGHVFLLPASHTYITKKPDTTGHNFLLPESPVCAAPPKRQNQPPIYVSVIVNVQ
jgi:hypothetical protein